jgi:uncharacterized protein (DUF2141 family)
MTRVEKNGSQVLAVRQLAQRGLRVLCASSICVIAIVSPLQLSADQASTGDASLIVEVAGWQKAVGQVGIAVYNSRDTWLDDKATFRTTLMETRGTNVEWEFAKLPKGDYAVAAFHDVNNDGKLNRNLLGIPSEPYGFSNGVRGRFGPARWEQARISVTDGTMRIVIAVK